MGDFRTAVTFSVAYIEQILGASLHPPFRKKHSNEHWHMYFNPFPAEDITTTYIVLNIGGKYLIKAAMKLKIRCFWGNEHLHRPKAYFCNEIHRNIKERIPSYVIESLMKKLLNQSSRT